jgi:integrase
VKSHALTYLKERLKDFELNLGSTRPELVTFDELAEDLKTDYKIEGNKSLDRVKLSISHLEKVFKGMRAMEINTPRIKKYIDIRLEEGAANATINRELAALMRMLNLGAEHSPPKVLKVPKLKKLKEASPREGFFEHQEFLKVLEKLPEFYRGPVIFGYKVGWRQDEILGLRWINVDMKEGTVSLTMGTTKNEDGRIVYLDSELQQLLMDLWEERKESEKLLPWVFPNEGRTNRILKSTFHKAWVKACKDAKFPGKLFHDLRRTAVRNMVRAGIPERVAMMVAGHKTRSIFDRYNIVDPRDLKGAALKIGSYNHDSQATAQATVHPLDLSQGHKKRV